MEQIVYLRCKNCGSKIILDKNTGKYICDACGSEFIINSDVSSDECFTVVAGVLKEYTGRSPIVKIPMGVSIIGAGCFQGMELIESISIPQGIVKIECNAFLNCKGLKYVSFPETLTDIGENAFKDSGLNDVFLPSSVINIGRDAFMGCNSLTEVALPINKNISYERTFKQCTSLSAVKFEIANFCLSFKPSTEAKKNGDTRSTLFDAFQATPFLKQLQVKQANRECLICGGHIGKNGICEQCGAQHVDFSGGCYIATAVYGCYDCPQVWTLRRFRDNVLAKTWYGRAFIYTYYAISPTVVKWFGNVTWFKNIVRRKLDRIITILHDRGVEGSPYKDKNW